MSTSTILQYQGAWLPVLMAGAAMLTIVAPRTAPAADDGLPTIIVSYADLDLSKPEGARILYARIKRAAHKVCAPLASREVRRNFLWRDCYEGAIANAVATVDRPGLTALHRSSTSTTGS
jgi:UrcA family protein